MHIRVFKIVGGSSFVLGLGLTDLAERWISGMDEYVKAALSGSVVGAVTGAAEMIPVGRLARAGVDFGAGAMGSAGSQMILDGKVELETMFHEGALAAVMAMVGRRLRGGGDGSGGKGSVEGVDDGNRVIGRVGWTGYFRNGKIDSFFPSN